MNQLIAIGDNVEFEARLAEAIAWCVLRADAADPKNSLRYYNWHPNILSSDRVYIVNSIARMRSSEVSRQKPSPVQSIDDLKGGRLMVYFPDAELFDGAAEAASNGFFDVHNVPPWDTWIGLFCDQVRTNSSYDIHLAAYVPESLVKIASDGIEANPEESIVWLRNSNTILRNRFRERGLLIWPD